MHIDAWYERPTGGEPSDQRDAGTGQVGHGLGDALACNAECGDDVAVGLDGGTVQEHCHTALDLVYGE